MNYATGADFRRALEARLRQRQHVPQALGGQGRAGLSVRRDERGDRPGRDPFELIGEVESVLGIGVYPITWPIFRGGTFRGVYHRVEHNVYLFDAAHARSSA